MKKRVLVTGATGFLGGQLCRALLGEGHAVRALVRRTSDLSSLPVGSNSPSSGLELAYGDVTDLPSLVEASAGCHVIFHAAALVEPWHPRPSLFLSVNVGGLKNVIEAYKKSGSVEKIIFTSSFFALGPTDGYVADETQVHRGEAFCTEYEKSKAIADSVAMQAAREGIPIVMLYPGVVYGPGKLTTGNIVARLLIERFNGRLPAYVGQGNDKMSFVHVEDVVMGHVAAMHRGRLGERYLLAGENAPMNKVFDIAAEITHTKKPAFHIPLWVVEIYGWISVFFARITGKLPLLSYPTVRVMQHQWAYSCQKAKEELGYNPRSLKEGLEEFLPWLRSSGVLKY